MKRALLFSGQGAQEVGMGLDLWEKSPKVKALYKEADAALKISLSEISFQGPADKLMETSLCQPALYVHGLALLALAQEEAPQFHFEAVAGLSLGEYTAHAAAGTFDFITGLKLVAERGRLMQEACEKTQGGMISLIGAEAAVAREIAQEADLDAANFNCPGQVVLSGALEKFAQAQEIAKTKGIRKAIPLKVAGAYHSRLMASAQEGLKPYLDKSSFQTPKVPVMANVTGGTVLNPTEIRQALLNQVCGSVLWEDCIRTLIANGVTEFVEFGPGGVLAGMVKRIDANIPCRSVSSYQTWRENFDALGK